MHVQYIYMYMYIYIYTCIYVYAYREREREMRNSLGWLETRLAQNTLKYLKLFVCYCCCSM